MAKKWSPGNSETQHAFSVRVKNGAVSHPSPRTSKQTTEGIFFLLTLTFSFKIVIHNTNENEQFMNITIIILMLNGHFFNVR